MGILSTTPTSNRGYLSQAELQQFADITINDSTEADDRISQAEEIIDNYVGSQDKFVEYDLQGLISAGGSNGITLESIHQNTMQLNYLRGCWFEIIGGTGEGQRRKITNQTLAGVVTFDSVLTTPADITSFYKIWQLGKFPRKSDTRFDGLHIPNQYYKTIPEKLRRAVAAQIEYMINMGEKFFGSDAVDMTAETIGDYSYQKRSTGNGSGAGSVRLIAPKAMILLKGILNRTGSII